MPKISLNHKDQRLNIEGFEIDSPVVFGYFDKLPATERGDKLVRALYIGVLALMEDRLSTFLSKTTNELGTELESLKMIFEMKQQLFYKSSIKGNLAEEEVAEFLNDFVTEKALKDDISLTALSQGKIHKNKTGDIVATINGDETKKIVIECKFDKGIRLGDISSKDVFARKTDTAWSQLIESQVNREGKVSLIVFDNSLVDNSISNYSQGVTYIPAIGFIVIVDSQKGDYSNLAIAYMLARDIAVNAQDVSLDKNILAILINRIVRDLSEILSIKKLVLSNIDNSKQILAQLSKAMLLIEFSQMYLVRFLKEGTLTKEDLLAFYQSEDVKDKFRLIEQDIEKI